MRLLGILAGVGIPHLRRPMPMLVVHLHSEPNGGSDIRHGPLLLYQISRSSRTLDFAPATLLPPRYLESTKAVLHVTRAASVNSMQCKPDAGGPFQTTQIT